MPSRRSFLCSAGTAAAGLVLARPALTAPFGPLWQPASQDAIWKQADDILARIVPPRFPSREFPVTRFGAVPDGKTDCTDAIRKAIAACHSAGGGRVMFPHGRFLTGPIHLKSRVNLHVSDKATLLFSRDPRSYLPLVFTRFEGVELMNYSPFIYAFEQEDVAITGEGTLDGQAGETHWWPWKGAWGGNAARDGMPTQANARARLFEMAARGIPVAQRVFGEGGYLRPNFIQPYRCKNVLIEGVPIVNSPMWEINPGAVHERHRPRRDDRAATGPTTTAAIPSRAATC